MPWDKPYRPSSNQRLDPELYKDTGRVTFITIRAHKGQSPFVRDDLSRLTLDTLQAEQERQHCAVFTYCLMPDHLHFLVSPRQDGISVLTFTDQFKGKATNRSWTSGWSDKLWQPRYYDHVVRTDEDLRAIAEYVLNNPVRQGLAEHTQDWLWSGQMNPLPW